MRVFILTRKRIAVLCAALVAIAGIGAIGAKRNDLAVAANSGGRNIPIYYVKTEEKKVSLSFDAAWGNEQTQQLLDILEKYKVKTTFFLVGEWVRNFPDDVKKISDSGHDIGNHSNTHPYMTKLGGDEMKSEIELCNNEVKAITGKSPTLFRPPYGDYNNSVVDTVNGLGMYCIQWSIDSLDWQDPSPAEITEKIKNNLAPGSIILMHNGAKNTPEALPQVIEYIQSQGYEIVPISQLLPPGKYTTDNNGMMIPQTDNAVKTAAAITSSSEMMSSAPVSSYTVSSDTSTASSAASSMTSSMTSSMPSSMPSVSSELNTSSAMRSSKKETHNNTSSYSGLAGELYNKTNNNKKKK